MVKIHPDRQNFIKTAGKLHRASRLLSSSGGVAKETMGMQETCLVLSRHKVI